MSFKITGLPQSVCTLRVLEVLAEKGVVDFELYKPNMAAKEHKVSIHIFPRMFLKLQILKSSLTSI
jgi:hypothetical protein